MNIKPPRLTLISLKHFLLKSPLDLNVCIHKLDFHIVVLLNIKRNILDEEDVPLEICKLGSEFSKSSSAEPFDFFFF